MTNLIFLAHMPALFVMSVISTVTVTVMFLSISDTDFQCRPHIYYLYILLTGLDLPSSLLESGTAGRPASRMIEASSAVSCQLALEFNPSLTDWGLLVPFVCTLQQETLQQAILQTSFVAVVVFCK